MAVSHDEAAQQRTLSRSVASGQEVAQRALHVCDLLEALADDLPKRAAAHWREAQIQCRTILQPYFGFLHGTVLPKLRQQYRSDTDRRDMLIRLHADCADQLHAIGDLQDLISDALVGDRFEDEPEALGFALRGYFDGLRRDLRWQIDVVWPLAARSWTQTDLDAVLGEIRPMLIPH